MRVAVTDACVFIDLIELDMIASFFQLDLELHTTVAVLDDCFWSKNRFCRPINQWENYWSIISGRWIFKK
jgi:hypothetical protein